MQTIRFLGILIWLEFIARIVGPKNHGPYLISLTMAEPMTEFEHALYPALFPDIEDD